jgi:hypothetical protein
MVKQVTNDTLCAEEANAFRKKATNFQFLSSVFQGVGGATLFGLVSSLVLNSAAVMALPAVALIGIPVLGVACIFIGTKCMLEAQLLNQNLSAKMVGAAMHKNTAAAPAVEQTVETQHTATVPPGMSNGVDAEERPAPQKAWAADLAHHATNASFAERLENAPDLQAARA